jgi:hypothetical protein
VNPLLASTRTDGLLLAAVLAGVALLFLIAGGISAVVGRRRRERELEVTDRDRAADDAEPTVDR